jgi:hypothetical protein
VSSLVFAGKPARFIEYATDDARSNRRGIEATLPLQPRSASVGDLVRNEIPASDLVQLTQKLESGLLSLITHVHLSKATNLQPEFCQQHKLSIKPQIEAVKVQLKAIARAAKRLDGHR